MSKDSKRGALLSMEGEIAPALYKLMRRILDSDQIDALILPMKVPSGDSYAWILTKDGDIIEQSTPLAAVMPVQGAKALKSLTRKNDGKLKVAALMRPCEVRAAVELSKLNQVNLETVTLISYDCPGALPLEAMTVDGEKAELAFHDLIIKNDFENTHTKPVCQICTGFSMDGGADVHIALATGSKEKMLIVAGTDKGESLLKSAGLEVDADVSEWQNNIDALVESKARKRESVFSEFMPTIEGFDNLADTFANCIGCHNCQSACPICYCRQCYFDSSVSTFEPLKYLDKAEKRGALSLPADRVMFHVGRMAHMSLSCVSCGQCTDACPVSIPVAKIFSAVAEKTQKAFEYTAGVNTDEAIPLKEYRMDEVREIHEIVKHAESQEAAHE